MEILLLVQSAPFSASGKWFSIREWRDSGPAALHVHNSDDEAWHILVGELTFRYSDPNGNGQRGSDGISTGKPATYPQRGSGCPLSDNPQAPIEALISAVQSERDTAQQQDIYRRFDSELLE